MYIVTNYFQAIIEMYIHDNLLISIISILYVIISLQFLIIIGIK